MARNPKKGFDRLNKGLVDSMSTVQTSLDTAYSKAHFSSTKPSKDLERIKASINANIDRITQNNISNIGMPNISKLYSRLGAAQGDKDIIEGIRSALDDGVAMDTVMAQYMNNKYLKDLDDEIDTICKYMPKLLEALDTRKDNVLCADNFAKDFIRLTDESSISKEASFVDRVESMKKKYKLQELFDQSYDDASKYGEKFVYIVPYKKALKKLLDQKDKGGFVSKIQFENASVITESGTTKLESIPQIATDKVKNFNMNITFSEGIIKSVVEDAKLAKGKMKVVKEMSINEGKFDSTLPSNITMKGLDSSAQEGVFDPNSTKNEVDVPGCIVKKLDRFRVIPIYIDDLCLGYYYIEFAKGNDTLWDYATQLTDPMITMKSTNKLNGNINDVEKEDQMLKYLSGTLSGMIDKKFINANTDLRKEIYMILKHNCTYNTPTADNVTVTFIPPEDMVHIKFREDPNTHRGISDLERALLPAKLYASLYITNTLAVMTRGQDKRVYYVKQSVDTNIAKTLLNTINQIKKSNFGIRQIENINSVLNITGRFNDYVIPTGPNGAPIEFEVMQGQNVEIKTELMMILEEMAINSTDIPLELIQARQSMDYAIQMTMSSSKFLRKVYKRQSVCEEFFSDICTKIYNAEYDEQSEIKLTLPAPMFLNITNTNQIITNTKEHVQSIVDIDCGSDEDEEVKQIYTRKLLYDHLGSYINVDRNKRLLEQARHEVAIKRQENNPDTGSVDDDVEGADNYGA